MLTPKVASVLFLPSICPGNRSTTALTNDSHIANWKRTYIALKGVMPYDDDVVTWIRLLYGSEGTKMITGEFPSHRCSNRDLWFFSGFFSGRNSSFAGHLWRHGSDDAPMKCFVGLETCQIMMTSSNRDNFAVTGHLCGEFTGHRWILRPKASDAELWCFLW